MIDTFAGEFPFMSDVPKAEKSRLTTIWEQFREAKRITEEKGFLVPVMAAAQLLGVSHQRVLQLVEAGRLERVDFAGHRYITEASLVAFARSERKAGRPPNTPKSALEVAKVAYQVAKGPRS